MTPEAAFDDWDSPLREHAQALQAAGEAVYQEWRKANFEDDIPGVTRDDVDRMRDLWGWLARGGPDRCRAIADNLYVLLIRPTREEEETSSALKFDRAVADLRLALDRVRGSAPAPPPIEVAISRVADQIQTLTTKVETIKEELDQAKILSDNKLLSDNQVGLLNFKIDTVKINIDLIDTLVKAAKTVIDVLAIDRLMKAAAQGAYDLAKAAPDTLRKLTRVLARDTRSAAFSTDATARNSGASDLAPIPEPISDAEQPNASNSGQQEIDEGDLDLPTSASSPLSWLVAPDLAIELGTANTQIFQRGRGIVLKEPSVIAYVNEGGRKIVYAVGAEAKAMLGKSHRNMDVIRPMRDGVIADFDVAEETLKQFIRKVLPRPTLISPQIVMCVPTGATPVERRAILECAQSTGARRVRLMEKPVAVALGLGLNIDGPSACMIVDIGAGTTEIAVLSLGGLVWSRSLRTAGDDMDEAIIVHLRDHASLRIGDTTAEKIKKEIGNVKTSAGAFGGSLSVKGRDAETGAPKDYIVDAGVVADALADPVKRIIDAVMQAFEQMPPELAADIYNTEINLTGGGAKLRGLSTAMQERISIAVRVPPTPLSSTIRGASMALESLPDERHLSSEV